MANLGIHSLPYKGNFLIKTLRRSPPMLLLRLIHDSHSGQLFSYNVYQEQGRWGRQHMPSGSLEMEVDEKQSSDFKIVLQTPSGVSVFLVRKNSRERTTCVV